MYLLVLTHVFTGSYTCIYWFITWGEGVGVQAYGVQAHGVQAYGVYGLGFRVWLTIPSPSPPPPLLSLSPPLSPSPPVE